jgi:hypothetical protein
MTDTIQTPTADSFDAATEASQTEEFLQLDPADIIIGSNVRTNLRPDHQEFRMPDRGSRDAADQAHRLAGPPTGPGPGRMSQHLTRGQIVWTVRSRAARI